MANLEEGEMTLRSLLLIRGQGCFHPLNDGRLGLFSRYILVMLVEVLSQSGGVVDVPPAAVPALLILWVIFVGPEVLLSGTCILLVAMPWH